MRTEENVDPNMCVGKNKIGTCCCMCTYYYHMQWKQEGLNDICKAQKSSSYARPSAQKSSIIGKAKTLCCIVCLRAGSVLVAA